MAEGDLVRKITISATGEGIEKTKKSVEDLGSSWVDIAAKVYLAKSAYDVFASATEGSSKGVADAYNAVLNSIKGVYEYIKSAVVEAWDLGKAKLQEYIDLNDKAANNSTDFYQKLVKGAADAKVSVDLLLGSLKSMNDNLAPKLDGSSGQNKIDELSKWGNFKGNTGVDQLRGATTDEERLRALTSFYRQAQDANQNLAAQEVVRATAGDAIAKQLSKDSLTLDDLKRKMDRVKATDLIDAADIDRAAGLKVQLEAAEKILSDRLKPEAKTLTTLIGVEMYAGWVRVVSQYAAAVQWMDQLFSSTKKVSELKPDSAWDNFWTGVSKAALAGQSPEQIKRLEASLDISSNPVDIAMTDARNRLGSQLQNPSNTQRNTTDVQALSDYLHKDRSKGDPSKITAPPKDAFDRAEEGLRKYIETTEAAAASIDATSGAQERLKAVAQLTAAGMKDGLSRETARLRAEMSGLADDAGNAAMALGKARIESSIKFDRATLGMSAEDVAIASQLKSLYPDVTQAINSSYAAQIKFNNAMRDLTSTALGVTKSLATDFTSALRNGSGAWDAFAKAGSSALTKISDKLMNMAIDGLWSNAFGGSGSGGFGGIVGKLFGSSTELPGYGTSSFVGPVPGYANGTNDAPGGWSTVGEEGPERMYVPKGATIVPNGQRDPNDGGSISAPVTFHIDATGADPAALARLEARLAQLTASLPSTIVATVKKAQNGRTL